MSCNRFRYTGILTLNGSFEELVRVTPLAHVQGNGHSERLLIGMSGRNGHLDLEVSQELAVALSERLPEVLAKFPALPECSGSRAYIPEVDL